MVLKKTRCTPARRQRLWRSGWPAVMALWLGFGCCAVWGLDASRLWLPVSYKQYHFELLASGLVAEAQRECESVVEGTADLDRSAPEKPVFRVLCRNADGRTFNLLVDGLTRTILTPGYEIDQMLTPEQRAERAHRRQLEEERRQRRRAAEKDRQLRQLKESYWAQCEQALQPTIANMLSVQWLEAPRTGVVTEEGAEFVRNLTARDFSDTALFFTAECSVTAEEGAQAAIIPTARAGHRF